MFPINASATTTASAASTTTIKSNSQNQSKKAPSSPPLPTLSLTSLSQEWPLEEYQEKRIMNALSQQQLLSPFLDEEYSDDEEVEELIEDTDNISPTASYFSDRALFQLNSQTHRQSLSNSLRCSICQRRFHSLGNLSNHTQLYHY